MSTLGLIARADNGGLGTQSLEFWRHMKPERTLIVLAHHTTRGGADVNRYRGGPGEVRITKLYPTTKDAAWVTSGVDWVFSAETAYHTKIWDHSRRNGARICIQANPELYDYERADLLVPATTWRSDIFDDCPIPWKVMPVPVNRTALPGRVVHKVRTFYHVNSNAMEDRNGTRLVLSACRYMQSPARLLIRGVAETFGFRDGETRMVGPVEVTALGPFAGLYHDHWPELVDALVLPRRYGGLCLPMQEAASLGLPIIALDTDPYADLVDPGLLVHGHTKHQVHMKGGQFDINQCVPAMLGAAMDKLYSSADAATLGSRRSNAWAREHSWDALLPDYERLLR